MLPTVPLADSVAVTQYSDIRYCHQHVPVSDAHVKSRSLRQTSTAGSDLAPNRGIFPEPEDLLAVETQILQVVVDLGPGDMA
eukprot:451759-Rhodomonas_salina.1